MNNRKLSLHDAELMTLHFDNITDSGQLIFRYESGNFLSMNLFGLEHVRCNMFSYQNVVYEVYLASQGTMSREFFEDQLEWLYEDRVTLTDARKEEIWEQCQKGELELMYINPSVGTELAVLCKRIECV